MPVEWVSRDKLLPEAIKKIRPVEVVLDIGSGIHPQRFFQPHIHLCCEPYNEYIVTLQNRFANFPGLVILQNTAQQVLDQLPDKSIDSVFLLDVIEHIEKDEGKKLLTACERVIRHQIIVFTPLGFMPQDYEEEEIDGWGLSGAVWQRHLSGWTPDDFDETWNFVACKDFHLVNGKGEPLNPPFGAFWAIKTNTNFLHISRKALLISSTLPPSDTQQAEAIYSWWRSLEPFSYALASPQNHSYYGSYLPVQKATLPAHYYYLEPISDKNVEKNWMFWLIPPIPRLKSYMGMRSTIKGYFSRLSNLRNRIRQIQAIVKKEKSELILVTLGYVSTLLLAYFAARRSKLPLGICVFSEEEITKVLNSSSHWLKRHIYQFILSRAKYILKSPQDLQDLCCRN